jgi:sulfur carrier protein
MTNKTEIIVNDRPCPLPAEPTVAQLLAQLGLEGKIVAVEVNRQLVPRAEHRQHRLAPGDHVEIVTLVGGG